MTAEESTSSVPTGAQVACFEAGIKFGSLYHQFAGTPVSPASAPSLAAAMEAAIENQPGCESVTVDVREDALAAAVAEGPADYTELTGRFFEAEVEILREGHAVRARMAMADGYPLMEVVSVNSYENP
ncbi:MAG: dihydroneopterin aldolase family protein [Salinirussus sp.]